MPGCWPAAGGRSTPGWPTSSRRRAGPPAIEQIAAHRAAAGDAARAIPLLREAAERALAMGAAIGGRRVLAAGRRPDRADAIPRRGRAIGRGPPSALAAAAAPGEAAERG